MNHHRISPARTDTPVPNPAPSRQRLQCGVFSTAASVRFCSLEMRCCRQMTLPEISNLDNIKSSQIISDNLLRPPTYSLQPAPSAARAPKGTTKHDKIRQKATNHDKPPMPMDFHPQTNQNRPWLMRWPLPDVWDAMSCRMAPRTPFPRHAGSACRRGPKVGTSRLPAERMPPS